MTLTGKTRITGIFGDPVEHSLSPAMHNAAYRHLGMDWCYVPFHVKPDGLPDAVQAIRVLGLAGVNVTVPHKEAVIPFLDSVDPEAETIGAVNTVVHTDGRLTGYNTDAFGFIRSLEAKGIVVAGRHVLILGAGGASRAVCSGLLGAGAQSMLIVNRTIEKADALAGRLKQRYTQAHIRTAPLPEPDGMDIVVNTTSIGLHGSDPLPLDPALLSQRSAVCDLVYRSGGTPFLLRARERGLPVVDGVGMLLWQGWKAFRLWSGIEPPVDVMAGALRQAGIDL